MFTAILINATPARRQMMTSVLSETGVVTPQHLTDHYPSHLTLSALCRQYAPDLFFLDLDEYSDAQVCLKSLRSLSPLTPIIGVGGNSNLHQVFMTSGVSHFLAYPIDFLSFASVVAKAIRSQDCGSMNNLYAFLPSKAGSGSTTVALCTAVLLANTHGKKTLCIDADLRSGVMSSVVGNKPGASTQVALSHADELDALRWHNFVHESHGVDFLLAAEEHDGGIPEWSSYFRLLRFVQPRYEALVVDLPELVNAATEEVVRRASQVFVVTTQEPCSLHLADRRLKELDRWGVPDERVQVIVNRWDKRDTPLDSIKNYLGDRVAACLRNNYPVIRAAMQTGQLPPPASSEPGRSLSHFVQALIRPGTTDGEGSSFRWMGLKRFLAVGS